MDDYSLDELVIHYEAAVRYKSLIVRQATGMIRVAMHAKRGPYSRYLKALENLGNAGKKPKRMTPAEFIQALDVMRGKVDADSGRLLSRNQAGPRQRSEAKGRRGGRDPGGQR